MCLACLDFMHVTRRSISRNHARRRSSGTSQHKSENHHQHGRGLLGEAAERIQQRKEQQHASAATAVAEFFRRFAQRTAEAFGSSWAFVTAVAVVLAWAATGPFFHFSDTWQLVINTGTTVVTFLMVFLIQNAQNRDAKAIHLKLDELIHSIRRARNRLITLEDCTDEELAELEEEFKRLAKRRQSAAAD